MQNIFNIKNILIALAVFVVLFFGAGATWYFLIRGGGTGGEEAAPPAPPALFPEGGEREPTSPEATPGGTLPPGGNAALADSFQLVRESISGAMFYKPAGKNAKAKIRYIEHSSGHLFEMDPDGQNKRQVSVTTIPGIYEVAWSSQGNRAILKYFSNNKVNVVSALFVGSTTKTTFLPAETKSVVFSPAGDRIAYVLPSASGASVMTATPDNKTKTTRLQTPLSSWRLSWPESNNIYLSSAPSAYLGGFLYKINLGTNVFTKVLGPASGFGASMNASNVLFSVSDPGGRNLSNFVFNISTGKTNPAPLKTPPEKCVWSKKLKETVFCATPIPFPAAIYPDDWYKGKVSFTDVIVKFDSKNNSLRQIVISEGADVTNPFLSDDESVFFFINKKDGSLWRVKLPS